jgi:hypothetical protein
VLATGIAFPDALSGVPLAKAKNGPLLLTDGKQSSVDPAVLASSSAFCRRAVRSTSSVRPAAAADRWTWLVIAVHTQLRLARPLAVDLRRPWERPIAQQRLTPARGRRGFRNIHPIVASPAGAPKPGKPGPGRPLGSKNRRPAQHHDVGKTVKRDLSLIARQNTTTG